MPRSSAAVLHVAALPFPSGQGTQAVLHTMLAALAEHGVETHLLCYAHGAAGQSAAPYRIHRIPDTLKIRSLRSGPSWGKLLLDLQLVRTLRRLHRTLRPVQVVAHHVEAALACRWAGIEAPVFFAHTDLGAELTAYFMTSMTRGLPWRSCGQLLDRYLARRASGVWSIAPQLTQRLHAQHDVRAHTVLPPWSCPPAISPIEREQARARYVLRDGVLTLLYAGNLDPYQGWQDVVDAAHLLARRNQPTTLLVGTLSESSALWQRHRRWQVPDTPAAELRVQRLHTEADRRQLHAAADVALVPRRSPGGLPIKLLDALGRGLPSVVTRRATAGLRLEEAAWVVADDDPAAIAEAVQTAWADPDTRQARAAQGIEYVAAHHSTSAFLSAWRMAGGHRPC